MPRSLTWDEATLLKSNFSGKTDWRLPSEDELISLVDYTKSSPAINTTFFLNEPNATVWSDSAYASYPTYKWNVQYSSGYASGSFRGAGSNVFMVRVGQPPAVASLTDTDCLLDWAEARFPDLLIPAHPPTLKISAIQYRSYSATGVYLGVYGTTVLVLGGPFGSSVTRVGEANEYLPTARAAACK